MSHLLKYGLRTEKGQDKEDNVLHNLPFFYHILSLFNFSLCEQKSFNGANPTLLSLLLILSAPLQNAGNNTPGSADSNW